MSNNFYGLMNCVSAVLFGYYFYISGDRINIVLMTITLYCAFYMFFFAPKD